MNIVEYQGYAYFVLTALLTFALYGYIYHLYSKKKSADDIDYEDYGNIALKDDITDAPISAISDNKKKK